MTKRKVTSEQIEKILNYSNYYGEEYLRKALNSMKLSNLDNLTYRQGRSLPKQIKRLHKESGARKKKELKRLANLKVCYIYFISMNDKFVKIGYSNDVEKRLADLQVGSPYKLKLECKVLGTTDLEKSYHKKFEIYQAKGEWFRFVNSIRNEINYINGESDW